MYLQISCLFHQYWRWRLFFELIIVFFLFHYTNVGLKKGNCNFLLITFDQYFYIYYVTIFKVFYPICKRLPYLYDELMKLQTSYLKICNKETDKKTEVVLLCESVNNQLTS